MAGIHGNQFKLCLDAITTMPSYTFAQLYDSRLDRNAVKTKVSLSIVVNYPVVFSGANGHPSWFISCELVDNTMASASNYLQ